MGLLEKAENYQELIEVMNNPAVCAVSNWYATGPAPLGKPITEEEIDRRLRTAAKSGEGISQSYVDELLECIGQNP